MSSKLTHAQSWKLTTLRKHCLLYNAMRLRLLIDNYHNAHARHSTYNRKEHQAMVEYFEELLNATIDNSIKP